MIVKLHTQNHRTINDIRGFLAGCQAADFELVDRQEAYRFIGQTLRQFSYRQCSRADKGVLRRYLMTVTGLSRAQLTRLIHQYRTQGQVRDRRGPPAKPFTQRYTKSDVRLLADLDALHNQLSGPATRKLCERAYTVFGDTRYQRLAGISNGHLYNLRQRTGYRRRRGHINKTRPTQVAIAERRCPKPNG